MYVIKMQSNKSLASIATCTIYQGERNADTLIFLIPKECEGINLADCSLLLRYILPNGIGKSEELEMCPLPYNKDLYQYTLKVKTRFTEVPGKIELWLTAIDIHDGVALKSGTTTITIKPTKDIVDYFSDEDKQRLEEITQSIKSLEAQKADSIIISDTNGNTELQLSSNNELIGNPIDLSNMVNNDLILIDTEEN